ncbi:MAG: PQQ-dependent sugar dehydrogenase, partial [Verrucomicrobiales bacterium]|nr:PQQ-dependent sugar dehydrogenase [Verrucomicrobiales bacterium]
MGYRFRVLAGGLSFLVAGLVMVTAQVPEGTAPKVAEGLELTRWAREPMLRSPVALSFDDTGRLYVVETARRGTVDIDIRSHPDWLLDDLANQSVDDLRRFFRTRMAPERSAENAGWLRDWNGDGSHDWRDLTTVKERVHRLEDTAGGGKADRAVVFAESFHEEITGVAAGVMPWGRDVFVTVYPDLWRLRDTNGDGVADTQESVARGFGVHAAFDGHDLHGLTEGPDGRIYFSVGDNGFSVTNREGRALHYPNTGGVLRMNPDGSELEVFASGLRNPQEIAFDEFGNLFAVDNDGDLAGERERFVVIPEGSDAGWRLHWQFRDPGWARQTRQPDYNPWTDEKMWVPYFAGQPAHLVPALTNYSVGPGSFKYNPGTALNERYRGHFFLIQFPVAKVTAFQVRPRGAGFEMVNEHTLLSGMMASAVNFGPDGALYVGDWDGMWTPSGKGSIW